MAIAHYIETISPFEIYTVEKTLWESPTIHTFDDRLHISGEDVSQIDIVLLGDGFKIGDKSSFITHIESWYDDFASLWPYSEFLSVFRVHAIYVESIERASSSQGSFYNIKLDEYYDRTGTITGYSVARGTENEATFKEKLFDSLEALDTAVGLNTRQYPEDLKIGWSGDNPQELGVRTGLDHSTLSRLCRNLVVAMAVYRDPGNRRVGGYAKTVESPCSHTLSNLRVPIAFAQGFLHEFSHAFAGLVDEYIDNRKVFGRWLQQNGSHLSVFDLWNVTYSSIGSEAPWRHIAWDGLCERDSNSYVGQMWIGGQGAEKGVWHSEYKCLVNGERNNYHHRTDELRVPAKLRTLDRYCLWCEEIVTIRIMEKSDAFLPAYDPVNPSHINELGRIWYWRWVDELRANYWREFDLTTRITDREAWYHNPTNLEVVQPNGVTIWDGNLEGTDLMREITSQPNRGKHNILFMCS